jgi:hypothetical protein
MTTLFNKRIWGSLLVTVMVAFSGSAFADTSALSGAPSPAPGNPWHQRHRQEMKQVFEACAKANDITLPAKGSGDTLSTGDRTALHACVKQFHDNMRSCIQKAGVSKPVPGTPPSAADKAAFQQCRVESLGEISSQ